MAGSISIPGYEALEAMFGSLSNEVCRNLEGKQSEIMRLTELLNKADESRQQWTVEKAKLEANATRLTHLLEKAEDSYREMEEARKDIKSQRDWFKSELERVRAENGSLKDEYGLLKDEARQTRTEIDVARQERDAVVKMLHQAQLEIGDWKREFEKSESSISHLRREISQWKDQARHWQELFLKAEEERRVLSIKVDDLREREVVAWKVKSEELPPAPLTPASSSRNAENDDSADSGGSLDSPIQALRGRSQRIDPYTAPQRRTGINVFNVSNTPKTPRTAKNPEAARTIESISRGKRTPRAPPAPTRQAEEEEAEEQSVRDAVSSPSPLVYPESDHSQLQNAVASSSKALQHQQQRSAARSRILRRVDDHQFTIKREEDERHQRQEFEDDNDDNDDDDGVYEMDTGGLEQEDQGARGRPVKNLRGTSSGGRAVDLPKHRSRDAWDLFGDDEGGEEGLVGEASAGRAGPSTLGRKTTRGRGRGGKSKVSRSQSRRRRKTSASKPKYAEEEEEAGGEENGGADDGDEEAEEGKVEYRRPRKGRSPSSASPASSEDELMITAHGPSSATGVVDSLYTPHKSISKKRAPTPLTAGSTDSAKRRRQR
ncbi:hypothetical protein D9757_008450 [Collybiopsis confluens]|uniref:Uncharacterized protein n=1 Tax=Collybiopsis confluens TaxID=2823264 RepID=A0A8H5M6B4_9AGAR|nr:hypothetical protein D9757_008450 [Collybiopsis confluens]